MSLLSDIGGFLTSVGDFLGGGTSTSTSGTAGTGTTAGGGGGITGLISNASGMFGSATAFLEAISDGKTWRSAGWLLLGVLLVILGVAGWVKGDLGPAVRPRQAGQF